LQQQKLKISYEEIIFENNYYYQLLMVNEKGGLRIKDELDIYFGPYLLKHRDQKFNALHQMSLDKIQKNNLSNINTNKKHELQLLERILKNENYRD
jgi:tRNA A22 N-methylase